MTEATSGRHTVVVVAMVVLLAGAVVWGVRQLPSRRFIPPPGIELTDLHGVDQLQAAFNEDQGATRLVVVFSPT